VIINNSIRECRKQLNLTQENLAELLGVSRQTINAIENEKYNPSLGLALKISKVFNKPVEELFILPVIEGCSERRDNIKQIADNTKAR
jgi:putative transcriptional regulator